MARIRYVKPEFFSDTKVAELSTLARLFYVGLFCQMDRSGIAEDDPKLLKREIFPYDDEITLEGIRKLVDELVAAQRVVRLLHEGRRYLFCPTFQLHQKFHPRETHKHIIPWEILRDACKTPAGNLLDAAESAAGRLGIGIGIGMGIGMGIGTGEIPGRSPRPPGARGAVADAAGDVIPEFESSRALLAARGVSPDVQRRWLEAFPDAEWVLREIRAAAAWEVSNPKRKKINFAAFITNWLKRGWDRRPALLPSSDGSRFAPREIPPSDDPEIEQWRKHTEEQLGRRV